MTKESELIIWNRDEGVFEFLDSTIREEMIVHSEKYGRVYKAVPLDTWMQMEDMFNEKENLDECKCSTVNFVALSGHHKCSGR